MRPVDRLGGVLVFVRTVEAGSFTGAADVLGLSRSAIAKAIGRLEARLGVRLFKRTTRRQVLTDEGRDYYGRCTRALAELDEADESATRASRVVSGRVRVSAPIEIGRRLVAPLLLDLARIHPGLLIHLSLTDRRAHLLQEGVDIAVRSGVLDDVAGLRARQVGTEDLVLCASPEYLDAMGTPATVADLARHAAIVYQHQGSRHVWEFDASPAPCKVELSPRFVADDLDAIRRAALAGLGIARLPAWLLTHALSVDGLRCFELDARCRPLPVHLLWSAERSLPRRVRAVLDHLADALPSLLSPA